jgi:hypothetical protein
MLKSQGVAIKHGSTTYQSGALQAETPLLFQTSYVKIPQTQSPAYRKNTSTHRTLTRIRRNHYTVASAKSVAYTVELGAQNHA